MYYGHRPALEMRALDRSFGRARIFGEKSVGLDDP